MISLRLLAPLLAVALLAVSATAQKIQELPFQGNATCPVSGEKVDQAVYAEKNGERVYVCCKACKKKVEDDFLTFKERAYPKDKLVDLKNENCPLMSKKAGTKWTVDFQGKTVRLCCKRCVKKFWNAPQKYLALAANPKLVDLKNEKCAVMPDHEVDGETFVVFENQLVNLCCSKCVKGFEKDPAAAMANVRKELEEKKKREEEKKGDAGEKKGA